MREQRAANGSVGLPTLLFLVFLVLKLTEVIDWSWWWVTAPLWGMVALTVIFLIIYGIIAGIVYLMKRMR